jgi:hypothetical protein
MSEEQDRKDRDVNLETHPSLDFSDLGADEGSIPQDRLDAKPLQEALADTYERSLEEAKEEQLKLDPQTVNKAKQFGHLSRDQWIAQGRDPSLWKDEREFVKYGDEFKETKDLIRALKEKNEEQSKKIDILVEAHKQRAETAVQQAKRELEAQLQNAEDRGDIRAVRQLTEQKVNVDMQAQQAETAKRIEEIRQVDAIFIERNKNWFNGARPELQSKVAILAQEIDRYYPGISYAEKARRIEERIHFEHPDTVLTSNSPPPISLASSGTNKSASEHSLPTEDRLYRALSVEERAEYNTVRNQLKNKNIEYKVSEYIKRTKELNSRGQ